MNSSSPPPRFFFDNTEGKPIVEGMKAFGLNVVHLSETYALRTDDQVWLAQIGQDGWFLVTRDKRIRSRPGERQALRDHKVGAFFMGGDDLSRWQQIKQLIRAWDKMNEVASKASRPFLYRVNQAGTSVDPLPYK